MVDFELIARLNPWWRDGGDILNDQKVREALSKTKQYHVRFFEKHGFYSLRGPRQVGKTTFLKLFIRHLIFEKRVDPKRILFFSCDSLTGKEEIIDVVNLYNSWADSLNVKGKRFILLDEITFINKWYESVKFLIDNNFIDGTLVFTGSLASDIKKGVERFPGREVKQIFYFPMTFREYAETFGSRNLISALQEIDTHNIKELKRFASNLMPYLTELNRLLENYMITGRYFRSSYEYMEKGFISEEIYEIYLNWVLGDLSKLGKNENTFKQIVNSITKKYGSPVSTNSIAKETDIGSHKTVAEYLDTMNDMLILNILPKVEISRGGTVFRKEKKYYFTDPFLYSVFSGYTKGKFTSYVTEENKSFILEGILLDFLRRVESKSYIKAENVWFYKDRRGEVDFIIKDMNFTPIEVKWKSKVDKKDFKHYDLFKNIFLLSKNTLLANDKLLIIPLSIFLSAK